MSKSLFPQLKRISNIENIFNNDDLDIVSLKCINCKKETGLNPETRFTWVYDQVITEFLLNAMLHHVGMSWIIISNKKMDYDKYTNSNHLDWFNTGPWYKKYMF